MIKLKTGAQIAIFYLLAARKNICNNSRIEQTFCQKLSADCSRQRIHLYLEVLSPKDILMRFSKNIRQIFVERKKSTSNVEYRGPLLCSGRSAYDAGIVNMLATKCALMRYYPRHYSKTGRTTVTLLATSFVVAAFGSSWLKPFGPIFTNGWLFVSILISSWFFTVSFCSYYNLSNLLAWGSWTNGEVSHL